MTLDTNTGGNGLKRLRERAGLTQQQLSSQTGISRSLISQWENGVISVSLSTKKRMADFLGVAVEVLDDAAPAPEPVCAPVQPSDSLPPRVVMSEAARQEMDELTRQYAALNDKLEQMLGRLTQEELDRLHKSAQSLLEAVETEGVFRQVKSFQQTKTTASREALTRALGRLLGEHE